MFGYITIHKDELKIKDYNCYQSYYCGLCRTLGCCYGQFSRLTLTYDMTFFIILLTGLYECKSELSMRHCPLHPGKRKLFLTNEFTQYAANLNILLTYYNLIDDWADEKNFSALTMSKFLHKSYLQAALQNPTQASCIKQYMKNLSTCEQSQERMLDIAAGYTGEMFGELLAFRHDEWSDTLKRLGFYLGKFIYLCDAWEDLDKDKKNGNYNPLIYCEDNFFLDNQFQSILTMMAAECAKEFEKLPILKNVDILRNILYSGIWTRYNITNQKRRELNKKL